MNPANSDPTLEQVEKMVKRLRARFPLLCKRVLKIHDADANLIPLDPNKYQKEIYRLIAAGIRSFQIHKSRQLGNSTGIAAYLFGLTMFTPRHKCLVIANTFENSKGLWEIYDRFVSNMPKWLKDYMGVESIHMQIRFAHGGYIKFYTAGSDAPRGKTFQSGHFSEVAFWTDPDRTYAGAMGALSGSNPLIFLESTANGPNVWQEEWDNNPKYEKVFFTWVADRTLDVPTSQEVLVGNMPTPAHINDLVEVHSLTDGQVRWAKEKYWGRCRGNKLIFRQEFPSTPEEAFVSSGDRVFDLFFKGLPEVKTGPIGYIQPEKYTPYILGADVAGGGVSGDYSAVVVLDVTNPNRPKVAFTYYDHITPLRFAEVIDRIAEKYKALVVVERNNHGLSVLERLVELSNESYSLYIETSVGKLPNTIKKNYGWWTGATSRAYMYSSIIEYISTGKVEVVDARMKSEINTLIWKGGKAIHSDGNHDDMLVAFGLALMGLSQSGTDYKQERIFAERPKTLDAIVKWNSQTGLKYQDQSDKFYDEDIYSPGDDPEHVSDNDLWM